MTLSPQSVTAASRIMLPAYIGFFAALSLNYLATPRPRLLASPSLAYADSVMPLSAWGGFFAVCAGLMLLALITGGRGLYRYALLVCALSMTLWTICSVLAAFHSLASPGGWAYPALVAAACIASERSLNAQEV